MARVTLPLLGVAAVLLAASVAFGQAPQAPEAAPAGAANSALLELLRLRLEDGANLNPADGVRLEEARFVRGTLRVRGTVASEEQAAAVRREIEALRPRLERAVEAPITSFDYTTLRVAERIKAEPRPGTNEPPVAGQAGQAGKGGSSAAGQAGKGQTQAPCTDCIEEYPGFAVPPPAHDGKKSHWGKKKGKGEEVPYSPWTYQEDGMWLADGPNAFMDLNCQQGKKHGHKHKDGKKAAPQCPYPPWMVPGMYYPY
jgi:hypothetical protein